MNCSVIILAWQDSEMTLKCADSMGDDVELIIVDNGSDPLFAEALERACMRPNRLYVRAPRNLGFAGGMNLGLTRATRDVVIFSNNDVLTTQPTLQKLVDVVLSPGVGAAFPAMVGPEAPPCGRFLTMCRAFAGAVGLSLLPNSPFRLECGCEEADWITGPFVAMRRLQAISMGGLPTQSFFYSEDYRLCWNLARQNLSRVVVWDAPISHARDASSRQVWSAAEIAARQTHELVHAAMDAQPLGFQKWMVGRLFLFGAWWRFRLRPSEKRKGVFEGAKRGIEESRQQVHISL